MKRNAQQHHLDLPYQIPPKTGQEIWEVWTGMIVTEPIFMKLTCQTIFLNELLYKIS